MRKRASGTLLGIPLATLRTATLTFYLGFTAISPGSWAKPAPSCKLASHLPCAAPSSRRVEPVLDRHTVGNPTADIRVAGADPKALPFINAEALKLTAEKNGMAFVPAGRFPTNLPSNDLPGPLTGPGQVGDSSGNWRAPHFDLITKPPSARGNYDSVETAFNGDWSHADGEEYRIVGPDTLGRPSRGYLYTPEASPHYLAVYNSSGWNNSVAGNEGRTGAVGYRINGYQAGQGDLIDYNASCFVAGHRPGATNFLANPACSLFAGDALAGTDGVYLNPIEVNLHDQGHDVAGIGAVFNFDRSKASGTLGAWWAGIRLQQAGNSPVDVAWSARGRFRFGLDLSSVTLDSEQAAIALHPGQRIYGNAISTDPQRRWPTSLGGDWIAGDPRGGWNIVVSQRTMLEVTRSEVNTPANFSARSLSSTGRVGRAILGNAEIVGRGATVMCAPGHECDQFSGTYLLESGTGITRKGILLTLGFAELRRSLPNCAVGMQRRDGLPVPLLVGTTEGRSDLSFVPAATLASRTRYELTYVCGGA